MKKSKKYIKALLFCAMFAIGFVLTGMNAECAETYIGNSATMQGANAYTLQVGREYYTTVNGAGYVSFVTPSTEGYVNVAWKALTINDGSSSVKIRKHTGEILAKDWHYNGRELNFEFKSEWNERNRAILAPNTRYYIEIGENGETGNVKLVVSFDDDPNPNGKYQAENVGLNRLYTRTIDSVGSNDVDYFKFRATSSGAHRFTFNNATCSASLNYEIRKWNSEELVKRTNGRDMSDYTYNNGTDEYDIVLEAGQDYYLSVYDGSRGTYNFSINNQCVKSISMNSSISLKPYETFKLNPVVSPAGAYNKVLRFSSSDSNVAYVNSSTGEVKAYRAGKAIITATATDGSNVSARCTVYVSPSTPGKPYCSSSSTSAVKMSWSSVSGASGYTVYRWTGKKWSAIKHTTTTSYTVKKLKSATGYKFKVRAYVNADGKRYSGYSDTGYAATKPKKTKITSISRLKKQKAGYGYYYRAKIRWKKSSGANCYKIYYRIPGSSYKYYLGTYKGTKATVSLYYSKYSTGSKKRYFYVVPVKRYAGNDYAGGFSKSKSYKFR